MNTPKQFSSIKLYITLSVATTITLVVWAMMTVTALTQNGAGPADLAARVDLTQSSLGKGGGKNVLPGKEQSPANTTPPVNVKGQVVPQAPENTANYAFATATNGSLTDMTSGTTQLVAANSDDIASALTNIGFDFFFQGARFAQFSVNDNGVLRLGAIAQTGSPYQPLAQAGLSIITAYGADQRTHVTGKVHFKVIGAAPNRTLVVEWLNTQANFNAGGTADLTYQVRLSETTGVIEFVYGSMTMTAAGAVDVNSQDPNIGFSSSNVANTVGSVTAAQSGAPPPTFDGTSATAVGNLYTAGAITVLTSGAQGSRRVFTFTPPTPTAPTTLSFTAITASGMTLNWTDSPDELIYAIYRSTDGVNFSFISTAAQNATSFVASGLVPSTTYFWQVYAVSEGALSSALAGSQATAAAGNIVSTGAGGNWSANATWVGGVVPTATDNVTIADGATVTIDVTTAVCLNLTVGQGTSGILQYISTPASTLTVNADATVASGGTFTAGAGVLLTHILNIGGNTAGSAASGNLTVNGTFDMNTTAGVTTNFFGTSDGTVSGAGATCDFFAIVMNKGTNTTPVENVTRLITGNAPTGSASRLTATNGTFKLSSASSLTPWAGSNTIIAATGRIWINNTSASITNNGVGTTSNAGSPTINGTLQVDAGTFGYGSGNNTMTVGATGTLIIGGANATVNMFGAVTFTSGATFTMTAGNFNIDPQAGNAIAATTNLVRFNSNTVNFTGGTLTIVDPHAGTGSGRALSISTGSAATFNFNGGTIRFGDGVSTTAGSVDGFDIDTFVGLALVPIGNVTVDNTATNAATRFVRVNTALAPFQMIILGDLTITGSGGSRFNLNGNLVAFGKNIINNGTLDGTTAASSLYWLGNGVASTYSGTGTSVAPLVQFDVDNPLGVTLDPGVSNVVVRRIDLFNGGITNANKLTLGNGDATVSVVQIGNGTTPTTPGGFDTAPTFNLGTGGENALYARETGSSRTTGPEINPGRALNLLSYDDNTAAHTLNIAGGDVTCTSAATALALTNGRVITGAFTIILTSGTGAVTRTTGLVDGNLRKTYAAAALKTFEVGTANGFSPVAVNITSGSFPTTFTVKAVQGPQPNIVTPAAALQRYWTLTAGAALTADLTFNYLDPTDIPVTANENNFVIFKYDGTFTMPGGSVNTAANTASIAGVTSFSDWTLAEPNAPTAVELASFSATEYDKGTYLQWQTGFEVKNLGFNVYRDEEGKRVRINRQLVAGSALLAGSNTVLRSGKSYSWWNGSAAGKPGGQYWLEAIDLSGQSTWHGPIAARQADGSSQATRDAVLLSQVGAAESQLGSSGPTDRAAALSRVSSDQVKAQADLAGKAGVKISVRREGWYRVTQADLLAAGFNVTTDPQMLQMYVDGRQVPISVVTGQQKQIAAVDFYGRGIDAAYTDARLYWLIAGTQPGLRVQQAKGEGYPTALTSFLYTVERKDKSIYFPALRNGEKENFFGPVIAADPVDQTLALQHVDQSSSGQAQLEVTLQGVTQLPHKVWIYMNGAFAGEMLFHGQAEGTARLSVSQSLLIEGDNQVRVAAQGGPSDVSLVGSVRLGYFHTFSADNDRLRFTATGRQAQTINGFSSGAIRVLDITDPDQVQEVIGKVEQQNGGYSITVASPQSGDRILLAALDGDRSAPAKVIDNRPSSLRSAKHNANFVIVTNREMLSSVEPLKMARISQGFKVEVVDVEDIFDEFSFGHKTPQAVRDFLLYAQSSWKGAPQYVLLVGDASLDPKGYLGHVDSDLVPTKLIDTAFMETASDDWLADFNADGMAELAVGRLPVGTAEEATRMIEKIVAYDQSNPSRSVMLVADSNDGYDFEGASRDLRVFVPSNVRVDEINRGRMDPAAAREQLIEAINRGEKIVNYGGHGSVNLWRGGLLTNDDAAAMTNTGRLAVFVMMTCLNGYFQDPGLDSLAESLMKAERGGAVAVWASSGMTEPSGQAAINQQMFALMFKASNIKGQPLTLGEAALGAKRAVGDADVRRTYTLFGDPTSRLR